MVTRNPERGPRNAEPDRSESGGSLFPAVATPHRALLDRDPDLRSQLILRRRPGVVQIILIAHAGSDAVAARRQPIAHEPHPRVANALVRPDVDRARIFAARH